jgi:8-oxo-dGTP diphosphatase
VADGISVARVALGAACAIFDAEDRVLLVHHTYGRLNWELPGGLVEPGESPNEGAARELLEETGLTAELEGLTGVYLEPAHDFGPMLHFVFRARSRAGLAPRASSPEISEVGWWPVDRLPAPMSDFTERRIADAREGGPVVFARIEGRTWRG